MTVSCPWHSTSEIRPEEWLKLTRRGIFECYKWDVQCEDQSVLAPYAVVIQESTWAALKSLAEQLSQEGIAIEQEVASRPDLHGTLGLPRAVSRLFRKASLGTKRVVRVMRFDFHYTTEGWKISEVNADVPGGFVEASGVSELVAAQFPGCVTLGDPARAYASAIRRLTAQANGVVGMVHATCYSDDRQVMEYLARELKLQNLRAIMLSPSHVVWRNGQAHVNSKFASDPIDSIVRFFPAEWLPQMGGSSQWSGFFLPNETILSNPGTAILLQTKRMALVFDTLETSVRIWKKLLPDVRCPRDLSVGSLDGWVLKPAFGRVGENIAIRGVTQESEMKRIVECALGRPKAWIAQRRFETLPFDTPNGPRFLCLGVFTIDGRAVGIYGRVSKSALIDGQAQDVVVLSRTA